MRGCSGASPHARLMRLLAQQRRVVLVDEYRSTKGCPGCCHVTGSMVQPKGNATYTTKKGHTHHKRVHGLSQCKHCHVLWSRDFAATLNIGKVFKAAWRGEARPAYLRRPTCGSELALSAWLLNQLTSMESSFEIHWFKKINLFLKFIYFYKYHLFI